MPQPSPSPHRLPSRSRPRPARLRWPRVFTHPISGSITCSRWSLRASGPFMLGGRATWSVAVNGLRSGPWSRQPGFGLAMTGLALPIAMETADTLASGPWRRVVIAPAVRLPGGGRVAAFVGPFRPLPRQRPPVPRLHGLRATPGGRFCRPSSSAPQHFPTRRVILAGHGPFARLSQDRIRARAPERSSPVPDVGLRFAADRADRPPRRLPLQT